MMSKKKKTLSALQGSLSVEAALSLTLFFFFLLLLAVPMDLLNTQRKIQMVLETASREMSRQSWMYRQWGRQERESRTEQGLAEADTDMLSLFSQTAAALSLEHRVRTAAGEGKLEGLTCRATRISSDGELIDLRAEYRLKLPFSVFALDSIPFSARSRRRGWIGREGGAIGRDGEMKAAEQMVFVGRDSTRYHLSADCHYLSNQMQPAALASMREQRSASGVHYQPCHVCGSEAGATVYIFPNGEVYHSRPDCPSVGYYIRRVPLSEVEQLGPCSYCGGAKKAGGK